MTSSAIVVGLAVFVASLVESVEALTIVVAAGVSRGWRSALEGTGVAIVVLVALVAALGPAIVAYVPIDALRAVVGAVLLVFGLQWLRKAVLRASGYIPLHDEDVIYARHVAQLSSSGEDGSEGSGATNSAAGGAMATRPRRDAQAFVVAFKGVFLEGLEVVIVVITLGATAHRLGLATAAEGGAVVLVAGVGFAVARQLAKVPENIMKMVVGLMLVSFGSFWSAEGLGVHWPGDDLAIPVLVGVYALATFTLIRAVDHLRARVA
ncbi:MAG: COG4280 domain-containing protein [Acidimicrobiales bacterium]